MILNTRILVAATLSLSFGAAHAATTPAPKGVKCGDSYIAAGQVCHKAPAAKGVKCGDSYIAAGQVCHKPTVAAAPAAKGKKCGNSYIAANATCTKK